MAERVKAHAASIDAKVAFEKVNSKRVKLWKIRFAGTDYRLCLDTVESQSLSDVIFRSEV